MKMKMTEEQQVKCHAAIHTASLAAGAVGAGLAQIPGSDSAPISAIQIAMVVSIGEVFGIKLTRRAAEATVASGLATMVGRGIAATLVGWIPIAGNIINASTAAGVTEALGWMVAEDLYAESVENEGGDD